MYLSELLIPCLIGHKIQALWFSVGAGQNNQKSSQMKGVARDFQLWLNSTEKVLPWNLWYWTYSSWPELCEKLSWMGQGPRWHARNSLIPVVGRAAVFQAANCGSRCLSAEPTCRQTPVPELGEPVLTPPVGRGSLGERVRCRPAKTLCGTTSSWLNKLKCYLEKIHWQGFE